MGGDNIKLVVISVCGQSTVRGMFPVEGILVFYVTIVVSELTKMN